MNEPDDDENNFNKVAETLARESDINSDIVIKKIDQTHPIGKINNKELQRKIVNFTSDSFKEKVFKKHKKKIIIIEVQKKKAIDVKINLQASLTKN